MLNRDKTLGVVPLADFLAENAAAIDFDLAVVGDSDRKTFERPGGGPFKVFARYIKSTAMARTLEQHVRFLPNRDTAQVRTAGTQGIDLLLAVIFSANDPDAELFFVSRIDVVFRIVTRSPGTKAFSRFINRVRHHEPEPGPGQQPYRSGKQCRRARHEKPKKTPPRRRRVTVFT